MKEDDPFAPGGAVDFDKAGLAPWPSATVEQVRDCILDGRMSYAAMGEAEAKEAAGVLEYAALAAADAVRAGRMIDAGHLPNAVIMSEALRAKRLITEGWIGQPFREPWVLYHSWEEGAAPLLIIPDPQGSGSVQIGELVPCTMRGGSRCLMLGDFGELLPSFVGGEAGFMVQARVAPLRALIGKPVAGDQALKDAACNLGDPLWTVLAMMATDGVDREEIPAPHRLNKQRAAKGKHPIPGRTRLLSAPYVTAILSRGKRSRSGAGGGHHASPVMHIRRGHPRTLPSGKRTWVRDCIVNAADGSPVLRTNYRITPGTEGP